MPHRAIRSFVRREGRITDAQRRALEELLPRFGVTPGEATLDFVALFGRAAPVHLEIGFGNGEVLATMAAAHPQNNYLGIEVHRPGVGMLLRRLEAEGLANVRVACSDARELLEQRIPEGSLSGVYVFFPDPWHK
ncbi:MAG TPA: tRNA (guanine(46)-N(7))-methyltransferase TrmB, partial [Acidiferrobacterales bacterium]|nr:tRNA (guanine(46)-N(7))-methyltransferase TrmB [Acidiferrobacterales bacterium]